MKLSRMPLPQKQRKKKKQPDTPPDGKAQTKGKPQREATITLGNNRHENNYRNIQRTPL